MRSLTECLVFKYWRAIISWKLELKHEKWFVPINWIQTMMVRCFEKGTLGHTNELRVLLEALDKYRHGFFQLFIYDWIAIPLVSTISVYGYFAFALIGRQFPSQNEYREVVDM
uniref:Bestrophin homolog n=1 Tax=Heterorhabditis bacteriophora TaxID=37862 RepID=A0A1I7W786_HETBA